MSDYNVCYVLMCSQTIPGNGRIFYIVIISMSIYSKAKMCVQTYIHKKKNTLREGAIDADSQ